MARIVSWSLLIVAVAAFASDTWPAPAVTGFAGWLLALAAGSVLWGRGGPVALWPLLIPSVWARTPPPPCGGSVRMISANLLMVNPDPAPLAAEVAAADADVVALQEYSPQWVTALASLRRRYPYRVEVVRDDSFGVALWSKTPLAEARTWPLDGLPQAQGVLTLDGVPVTVWVVHTLPPRTPAYALAHADQMKRLAYAMESRSGELIVTGDFNASGWSGFHGRVTRKFDDAWSLIGRGPGWTWPNGVFPLPPTRLDHVYLSRGLTPTEMTVGVGAHSDHKPLRVTVARRAVEGACGAADGPG